MVAHFTMCTHGVNHTFRFVEGIWLHRKRNKIRFFFEKWPCLHHTCATWNEQPSNIKNHGLTYVCTWVVKKFSFLLDVLYLRWQPGMQIRFNLSYDGGFTDLSYDEGGAQSAPPIFICENHRKSNKIMHCVEKKIIRLAVLKIKPFFM